MAMLRGPNMSLTETKLSPRFIGPFRILERVEPVAYRLELPEVMHAFHKVFHVSMLRKCLHKDNEVLATIPADLQPSMTLEARPVRVLERRILCQRLKRFLPRIVAATQGAFVSGRLISDNILLAHEIVHALNLNADCDEEFIAVKTDMSKAYDRMEWSFLEELLIRLGFDIKWVQWIMVCVRSVSLSVLLNGIDYGFIKPERGIRQGDPLSPFLFILCAEALVHVMNRAEQEGRLTGMRLTPDCPSIQHLLFADDSLFLCHANLKECGEFLHCLDMDPYMRRIISSFTGIEQVGGAGKYLGLPECFSGSKRELLAFLNDRLYSRLKGWHDKTLSLGGKAVLLKYVAINAEDKQKMHWVAWDKVCKLKSQGGLGFRDIGHFNQALLAKQAWRMLDSTDSLLARVHKSSYFPRTGLMEAVVGSRPSWRSIMFGRELLEKGLMKTIGNGCSTRVWLDKWGFDEQPRRPLNKNRLYELNLLVSTFIRPQGDWNVELLNEYFPPCDVARIRLFPPEVNLSDKMVWAYTNDGRYSVKSGYWLPNNEVDNSAVISEHLKRVNEVKEKVWKVKTIPKIHMFLWRVLSGAIAVASCMRRHGLNVNPLCSLCHLEEETISHVLFRCSLASQVWSTSGLLLPSHGFMASTEENIDYMLNLVYRADLAPQTRNAIPWILWEI
ncbi:uncharacterized protein LOC111829408 [Capsella rubella]|uniref:uncharacterized protein LOC111829408 n=1 Tax=Capsella rubella TaxID=81985 RepID=UPI000CD49D6E|nr:uncharacterized protein LOC111829408 [Capsella rubella]